MSNPGEPRLIAPGERGPKGDHGQQGDSGPVGNDGMSGERGLPGTQGVPGPTGAAGAAGAAGGGGAAGAQGDQGVQGFVGAPGKDSPVIGRTQVLVLFAFMVFAFVLLAIRSEANASNIRGIQHDACIASRVILTQFNEQQENLARLDRDNPVAKDDVQGQKLQAARIAVYQSAKISVPTDSCPRS